MKRVIAVLAALALLFAMYALAEGVISTRVVMRVTQMTQSAVIDAGQDLSLDVAVDGVNPSSYQWYFDGRAIPGATQSAYSIVDATVEDSGIYRLDAFDEDGRMLVSMDISARVIDKSVPKSGDASLPIGVAAAVFGAAALTLIVVFRRRSEA